jgi:hypothetical protein
MEIDDEIATFLSPGPFSVVIGSTDAEQRPEVVRGWAPRIQGRLWRYRGLRRP